jgi:signal transduction histidine kinase
VALSLRSARQATDAARRELEHVVAELERFTYTVSHDLRSPLVTVTGFLGAVEALRGDTRSLQSDMARVRAATQRMDRLLRELLELSRVGRTASEPVTVPFADLVHEAIALVDGRLQERGVRVELAEPLRAVRGDRPRLVELVQNLLDNAAKFMGDQEHPRVEVGARAEGPRAVFFVRDNGRGIEPRYHDSPFCFTLPLASEAAPQPAGLVAP